MRRALEDGSVTAACVASAVLVAVGTWGSVQGGDVPMTSYYGWHPVMMVLGGPCLMTMGRWVYLAGKDPHAEGPASKCRQNVHLVLMVFSCLSVMLGYAAIILCHPNQAFGYNYQKGHWAEWRRVLHALLGHLFVLLVCVQAVFGVLKYVALGRDKVIYTFHNHLGRTILALGMGDTLLAVWFMRWDLELKALLSLLLLVTVGFGVLWRSPVVRDFHYHVAPSVIGPEA
mmetsp:Transcript_40789/g.89172  ORF Transcript_40789/g.89172 Transcript_40789/m.89172 type:complete len:229 (-) Transcript_40789:71-757(-)